MKEISFHHTQTSISRTEVYERADKHYSKLKTHPNHRTLTLQTKKNHCTGNRNLENASNSIVSRFQLDYFVHQSPMWGCTFKIEYHRTRKRQCLINVSGDNFQSK